MENTPAGVSIHEIDKGVDTGPIIYKKKIKFNFKKNKNLTFKSTYKTLFREAESLFEKKLDKLISYEYKSKKQKKRFSLHKKKDLPESLKNWNKKILSFKNNF